MSIIVTSAPTYFGSDGQAFKTRKEAVEHSRFLQRIANLRGVSYTGDFIGDKGVGEGNIAEFIATNADAILAALDVKETRKSKVAAS